MNYENQKGLKLIVDEFLYGGHLQSLGAASIVFVSVTFLSIKISWDVLFITYLIFYSFYLYNRYKEIDIDYQTNKKRTEHIRIYFKKIPVLLTVITALIFVGLIHFSNYRALLFVMMLLFLGFLYSLVSKKITRVIPFFKNFYVSAFFSVIVFFPFIYYSYSLSSFSIKSAFLLAGFVYLKAFLIQIFLDIKDIKTDQKEKLITLPVLIKKKGAINFLLIGYIVLGTIISISLLMIFSYVSLKIILFFTLVLLFDLYSINLIKNSNYFGYLLGSGEFLFWSVLIIAGRTIELCL